jgi:ABC-type lipoprotein release transport system permease subunit
MWAFARFVEGLLFEIQPQDMEVYAGAFTLLTMTGLAVAFFPARRAARVDPLVALRME